MAGLKAYACTDPEVNRLKVRVREAANKGGHVNTTP